LSADVNAYSYRYTNLRSGSQSDQFACNAMLAGFGFPLNDAKCGAFGVTGVPVMFVETQTINGLSGRSDGIELSSDWLVVSNWRLQLSYSWSRLVMDGSSNPSVNADAEITQRSGPRHYGSLRSQWNITTSQQFDLWLRASGGFDRQNLIDTTPSATGAPTFTHVPGYLTADLRYAYRVNKDLELALIGRNLINRHRLEYVSDFIPTAATALTPSWLISSRWSF